MSAETEVRPSCGARTRAGDPCRRKPVLGKDRCANHGGMSTGPKTEKGRRRIADAQRRRWQQLGRAGPGLQDRAWGMTHNEWHGFLMRSAGPMEGQHPTIACSACPAKTP